MIDPKDEQIERLKAELSELTGYGHPASYAILRAEVARLTAERDEAKESVLKWTGESAEYARQLAELRKDGDAKDELIKEAIGCFDAALTEGLETILYESTDPRLKDLYERRIGYAYSPLCKALALDAARKAKP